MRNVKKNNIFVLIYMIPKNLKYTSKVESSVAKSYRTNIQPQGGTGPYLLGDTVIINIPTRSNLVLGCTESYLKFKMNITSNNAANNFRFDSQGAHSVIRRCRVFSGSNLLEDIDSYGMLAKIMNDLYMPTDSVYGKLNACTGTRNDLVTTTLGTAAATGASCFQTNSGDLVGSGSQYNTAITAPAAVASGTIISDTYCINLISIMGALCSNNYFPLFACSSAPIRIELTLAQNLSEIVLQKVTTTANTVNFTNVEYIAQFIELGDSAMQQVYQSLGQEPLQFVVPGYRNYQFNATIPPNVSTQISMPVPAKFSSLKSIIVSQRDQFGVATVFPYSSVSMGIQNYQWRCGSIVLPSKPPETIPEMFQELCKVAGSLADLSYQPSIEKFTYQYFNSTNGTITGSQTLGTNTAFAIQIDSATSVSNNNSGSFYVGVDFENYPSSEKSKVFSGYNSNNDDIYFNPTYIQNLGLVTAQITSTTASLRYDAFANFDMVLVFESNTCYSKF
jgi:hypothetical protein